MSRLWRRTAPAAGAVWSRPRILGLLAAVATFVVLMLAGLTLVVGASLTRSGDQVDLGEATDVASQSVPPADEPPQEPTRAQGRDALAAAPMLQVAAEDARSGEPDPTPGASVTIPDATAVGASRVPSGFPRTPEGAIGQLAAVEVVVLQAMSIPRAVEVHQAWADPAAGPAEEWRLTGNVRSFLGAARMGPQKDLTATITVTPVAAQVKATDGPDWVIACVLVQIRAVIAVEQRMAYGYCERMQWTGRRWTIAPGTPPATAPSTWPGTALAGRAGWRTWRPGWSR